MTQTSNSVPFLDLAFVNNTVQQELSAAFATVLSHGKFVGGPEVEQFELNFARFCETSQCVGVGNGTDALELILLGLGIGPGDEVIVPTNTFIATAEAVCAVGARPKFVDVLPDTLLIDPDAAAAAVSPATSAIIAVHLFGQPADMDSLKKITERNGLALIEDAAQAHGARYRGSRAGSLGDAAAFSFYPGKNLGALGDGGAVVTNASDLASKVRSIANHGRADSDRYRHDHRGRNSRLDSLQAAVLSIKLARLDEANEARRRVMARYAEALPASVTPVTTMPGCEPVHHLAVVKVMNRPEVILEFERRGIGWGIHYPIPCHMQDAYKEFFEELPVAEAAAQQILSVPMSPNLESREVDRVCSALHDVSV